jgi:23S rRNA (uracil1939-C5)-methyltransferase
MENPDHYRNKVHATFSYDKKGKIVAGIFEEDSHRVIPVTNCLIQNEQANRIIQTIRKLMPSFKLTPYDEDYNTGFLRHVLIRTGHVSKQVMVVLVGGTPIFPSKNNFTKALLKEHPEITTVVFNINPRRTSMVLGDRDTVLYGKGYIEDTLCGKTFRLSPKSFFQVNSIQTEKLYKKALLMANLTGKENVLDAYCGIGTIGIIASDKAGEVIGVELNKDAVSDAITNAKSNKVENARFYQGDAGDFMFEMAEEGEALDVVIMDPPRSGSDERFLNALITLAPPTVVYISCGPDSLARDLKVLVNGGYKVKEMVPVDMFPWTEHVETVVLMSRVEK